MNPNKVLWVIPTPIGPGSSIYTQKSILQQLQVIFCESEKAALRYLASQGVSFKDKILIQIKKPDVVEIKSAFEKYKVFGLITDAGYPCLADAGAHVVWLAHRLKIEVRPLVGPNSIIMTLAASGFDGNKFEFFGYPPIENRALRKFILKIQYEANKKTCIFIEAPHRSEKTYMTCLEVLHPSTHLCIGVSLDHSKQKILSMSVEEHKMNPQKILREPTVFIIAKPALNIL